MKTGTCTKCDQYNNRAEAYKTDEQRYSEEQDAIDKETAKKLREMADEERMNNIPSLENKGEKKYIRTASTIFERILKGDQNFMIVKNEKYKVGDLIMVEEFKDGKATGRDIYMMISHIEDDSTSSALDTGFCVIGLAELNENGEPLNRADINQICADIRANSDGYIEGGADYILIENAISIIAGGAAV